MSKNSLHAVYIETNRRMLAGCMFFVLMGCAGYTSAQNETDTYRLALDTVKVGQLPAGWKVSATNSEGPLAQWAVGVDTSTNRPENILSIVRIQDVSTSVFNLNWTKQVVFQNGELSVRLRANSGKEDQGGGIIWRVQDESNYYVARYNPLESNFRLYFVEDGLRNTLASAEHLPGKSDVWNQIRIEHHGQHIQGWFNNSLAWEINDTHLPNAGGVGLWSKADAASSFAVFKVRFDLAGKSMVAPK